jgi:hypothetical protein
MSDYVMMRQIIIPAGTTLARAPRQTTYFEPHYEILLALGRDHVARLTVPESALRAFPDIFTKINKDPNPFAMDK